MELKNICSSLFVSTTHLYNSQEPVCSFLPKCLDKPAKLIALIVAPFFDLLAFIPRMIYSCLNRTVCPASKDKTDDVFGEALITPPTSDANKGPTLPSDNDLSPEELFGDATVEENL